jgi:hypothetical protein
VLFSYRYVTVFWKLYKEGSFATEVPVPVNGTNFSFNCLICDFLLCNTVIFI